MEQSLKLETEECLAARLAVQQAMRQDGSQARGIAQTLEKLQHQSTMLANMRKENDQLLAAIQRKDRDLGELQDAFAKAEDRCTKYAKEHKDFVRNERVLKDTKREVSSMKRQVAILATDKKDEKKKGAGLRKAKVEELLQQQRDIETKIAENDARIASLTREAGANPPLSPEEERELERLRSQARSGTVP